MNKPDPALARVHSFPPLAQAGASVLILGTMPGKVSLHEQQYYAHPRNAFWRILGEVLAFDAGCAYETRTASLVASGIALWDVLRSCVREGSLDSDIDRDTLVFNDFAGFFAAHPRIRRICFNGAKAENLYMRHVQPSLQQHRIEHVRLPSTSPANAGMPFVAKVAAWRAVVPSIAPPIVSHRAPAPQG